MKWAPPFALAILLLALYGATFSRTIYLEDSPEFVTAAATLSIPHPSGYPTYLLTAKLISLTPFLPTIVERINFVSALWTIAAVVLLYYVLLKLLAIPSSRARPLGNTRGKLRRAEGSSVDDRIIAFSLALLFGIAPMVWQQATYAEVYSLNTFFFVLLLWSAVRYYEQKTDKRLYLFFFLYGLSLTNHFLPLALAPLVGIWLFMSLRGAKRRSNPAGTETSEKNATGLPRRSRVRSLLAMTGCFLLGLAPYLYIPIRNQMDPVFSWFGGDAEKILTYNIAYGWRVSEHTLSYLVDVASQMTDSFGALGILAFLVGLGMMLYQRHPARHWLVGALALLSIGLVVVLTNGRPYAEFESQFYQTLYVPFLLFALLPIGYLLQQMTQSPHKLIIFYTSLLAIMAWPAADLGNRFLKNDRSGYVLMENYTRGLLESLPQGSALYAHHDHIVNDSLVFGLAYQRYVAKARPDATIYSLTPVFPPPADFPLGDDRKQNYEPVLKTYLDERYEPESVMTTFPRPEHGLLALAPKNYAADNLYLPSVNDNLYHQSLLAKYYYDLAMQSYAKRNLESGQRFLVRAIEYDPEQFSGYYRQTLAIRNLYFSD